MTRAINFIAKVSLWAASLLIAVLTGFVALAVVMRYFAGSPIHFTEELVGLMYMLSVLLAMPISAITGGHLAVTVFSERLRGPWARIVAACAQVLMFVFCAWFGWIAYEFMMFSYDIGSLTDSLSIPLWPIMLAFPAVFALLAVTTALRAFGVVEPIDELSPQGDL